MFIPRNLFSIESISDVSVFSKTSWVKFYLWCLENHQSTQLLPYPHPLKKHFWVFQEWTGTIS